jgi:hypothetical protein
MSDMSPRAFARRPGGVAAALIAACLRGRDLANDGIAAVASFVSRRFGNGSSNVPGGGVDVTPWPASCPKSSSPRDPAREHLDRATPFRRRQAKPV